MTTLHPDGPTFEDRLLDELLSIHAELGADTERQVDLAHAPRRRRRTARVAVAALAAAGVVVAVLAQALPGGVGRATPAAAAELSRLAATAATLPSVPAPKPGQFQYTDSVGVNTSTWVTSTTFTVDVTTHRQIWIGPDGSGRLVESSLNPTFPTAADRANWVAAGSPALTNGRSDESFGPGGLSVGPVDLWTLPTDPATLAARISSRQIEGGPPGAREDFVQVGDLLRETSAPPEVRAALFEVATQIPGVRLVGTVRTPAGLRGTAVALVDAGPSGTETLHELVFDPATSALVGTQDVVVDPTAHTQRFETWTSYLSSTVVDSTTATQ